MIKRVFIGMLLCFIGCARPVENLINLTLLIDCSSSVVGGRDLIRRDIKECGRWWLQAAMNQDGGRFEVMAIGTGIDDVDLLFSERCPRSFEAPLYESKKRWVNGFQAGLDSLVRKLPSDRGSGIAEAVFRATGRLSEFEGEKILVIFSDMRQINDKFNFEISVPDEVAFKCWLKEQHLTPTLGSIQVLVSGFRPYAPNATTKRISPVDYSRLRRLWVSLFKECGANSRFGESLNIQSLKGGDVQ